MVECVIEPVSKVSPKKSARIERQRGVHSPTRLSDIPILTCLRRWVLVLLLVCSPRSVIDGGAVPSSSHHITMAIQLLRKPGHVDELIKKHPYPTPSVCAKRGTHTGCAALLHRRDETSEISVEI